MDESKHYLDRDAVNNRTDSLRKEVNSSSQQAGLKIRAVQIFETQKTYRQLGRFFLGTPCQVVKRKSPHIVIVLLCAGILGTESSEGQKSGA